MDAQKIRFALFVLVSLVMGAWKSHALRNLHTSAIKFVDDLFMALCNLEYESEHE